MPVPRPGQVPGPDQALLPATGSGAAAEGGRGPGTHRPLAPGTSEENPPGGSGGEPRAGARACRGAGNRSRGSRAGAGLAEPGAPAAPPPRSARPRLARLKRAQAAPAFQRLRARLGPGPLPPRLKAAARPRLPPPPPRSATSRDPLGSAHRRDSPLPAAAPSLSPASGRRHLIARKPGPDGRDRPPAAAPGRGAAFRSPRAPPRRPQGDRAARLPPSARTRPLPAVVTSAGEPVGRERLGPAVHSGPARAPPPYPRLRPPSGLRLRFCCILPPAHREVFAGAVSKRLSKNCISSTTANVVLGRGGRQAGSSFEGNKLFLSVC